jgi:hypothetical protein
MQSDSFEAIATDAITIINALGHEDLSAILIRRMAAVRMFGK